MLQGVAGTQTQQASIVSDMVCLEADDDSLIRVFTADSLRSILDACMPVLFPVPKLLAAPPRRRSAAASTAGRQRAATDD
jgi:hypothetical protein